MTDQWGRTIDYLRVSVTDRCNLRCRYCMPRGVELCSHSDTLRYEELLRVCAAAVALGVTRFKITGGEPLVRRDCAAFLARLKALPGVEQVTLTTNALLLSQCLDELAGAGVDGINISLDTLDPERYRRITGFDGGAVEQVLTALDDCVRRGIRTKINAVLLPETRDEPPRLAALAAGRPVDVRFIELMPMPDCAPFGPEAYIPCDRVIKALPELEPLPGGDGVARLYRLPGGQGRVGLISPLSDNFCGWCNRLRLTADGRVKPCLHSPAEFSIKGLDREGMRRQFLAACAAKPEQHPLLSYAHRSAANRSMNRIGG